MALIMMRQICDGAKWYRQHFPLAALGKMLPVPILRTDPIRGWICAALHQDLGGEGGAEMASFRNFCSSGLWLWRALSIRRARRDERVREAS